jgi:hypothetical protein
MDQGAAQRTLPCIEDCAASRISAAHFYREYGHDLLSQDEHSERGIAVEGNEIDVPLSNTVYEHITNAAIYDEGRITIMWGPAAATGYAMP